MKGMGGKQKDLQNIKLDTKINKLNNQIKET